MMLTRTTCFAQRWIRRCPTAMPAARRRWFAFAEGNNAWPIDAARSTSSAMTQSSFYRRRDQIIAVGGSWMIDPLLCEGGTLPDTLASLRLTFSSESQCRFRSGRGTGTKAPRFSDRQTLEENVEAAYDHIDILSPRDVAAFWTVVSKIQKQDKRRMPKKQWGSQGRNQNYGEKMSSQLDEVLCDTMEGIRDHDFRGLAQTTLGLAKVVENLDSRGERMSTSGHHDRILHGLLIGNKSEIKQFIFKQLAHASVPILRRFDARHLSNFIYAFGLVKHTQEFEDGNKLFDMVALAAMRDLERFNSQDFANMLWAYANAEVSNHQLFKNAGDVIERGGFETFNGQDIANIVWAYATLNEPHPKLFKKVADHIMALNNFDGFKPQELSNIAWAYAKANESHPKLFQKVVDHIMELGNLGAFNPLDFSHILWAYATANESHPKLFQKVADHIMALSNLGKFDSQALSNIVWAYAKANEFHPKLFKKIAVRIMALGNLAKFAPQALSNIVWAYATANESHPLLFKKVAEHIMALENLGSFNPQNLSNIVWAYAKVNEPYPKLFKRVAEHIMGLNDLGGFIPQALSNIAWAYATAKEYQPALFQKLGEVAIQRKAEFNSQGVANFLWAHAANGHMDENLFQMLAPMAEDRLDECNEQKLANIAWAFAVANVPASSLFDDKFVMACKDKEREFIEEGLTQLHQWQIWQEELNSHISLPLSLRKRCHGAFVSQVPTQSALQDDVISELKAIGLHPEEEVLTKRGYRIDAVVKVNGNKIGVEVDGPFHFIGRRPTGNTILKRRQVANVEGLPILSVPYWDWNKLKRDGDKKQKYLCSLLGLRQS